jgi:hypothetical protein
MSEPTNSNRVSLENINWREAFPFTNLFRTFKLAIHPSKLILALAAVLTCYIGGRVLDLASSVSDRQVVVAKPFYSLKYPADEIQKYISSGTMVEFYRWREQTRERNDQLLAGALAEYLNENRRAKELIRSDDAMDNLAENLRTKQNACAEKLDSRYEAVRSLLVKEYKEARKTTKDKDALAKQQDQNLLQLEQAYDYLRLALWKSTDVAAEAIKLNPGQAIDVVVRADPKSKAMVADMQSVRKDREEILRAISMSDKVSQLRASQGLGIFQASLSYEILMFNSAVDSILGMELFRNPDFKDFDTTPNTPPGLVRTLELTCLGLGWFVQVHWFYFIVYSLFCLAVWGLAGGALCRIAALHATRDEKIPLREAVSFATKKFGSFFTAPLMPVFFILGCCLPLLVIGLVGAIPFLGELLVGLTFFIVLLISFVLAMIIIGGVSGLGLLFPTIAVEGSDTFDAFSRSYSYVYARPWRTIFYTLVAAVYGTLCFIFVKVLVGLVFGSASAIVGFTMNLKSAGYAAPLGKLQAMWFSPTLSGPFFGRFYLFKLSWSEAVASFFIALWVFLLVGLVIAFAVSFFFSAYTLIYLLLRRCVDATELDEVYVEEVENKLSAPPVPQPEPAVQSESVVPPTPPTSEEPPQQAS